MGANEVIAAHDAADQPGATFMALQQALAASPGFLLFTILVHHPGLRQSERYWSSRPDEYPVGGRKPITDSPWMQRVIHNGQPYIGRSAADIREVFYDHALIASLGCESVLNFPVRWAGQTLGTLNLLHRAAFYAESQVPGVRLLAHLALPALFGIARV